MVIDLNLYRVFYTVAKCKNISHAADMLFVSQPAVSKSVKTLENVLNIKLFSRSSKGVTLTPEGHILYEHIEHAFNQFSIGEDYIEKLKNKEIGSINLGVSTTIGKHFFLPRFRNFMNEYPNFKIKIVNRSTFDTIRLVQEEKLDIGIIGTAPVEDDIGFIKVKEIHDILVASSDYIKMLDLKCIDDIFIKGSFMLLENPNATREFIDQYFDSQNLKIVPDIEASNMDFLIECAKTGLGITSTLKEFFQEEIQNKTLVEIPIKVPIPSRNIGVIYKKNSTLSIAANTLIDFLQHTKERNI